MQDVLWLDLTGPSHRLGRVTRNEVLAALKSSGFRHPALDELPASDLSSMARSLERMQVRINEALRTVAREIGLVQERLRRKQKV